MTLQSRQVLTDLLEVYKVDINTIMQDESFAENLIEAFDLGMEKGTCTAFALERYERRPPTVYISTKVSVKDSDKVSRLRGPTTNSTVNGMNIIPLLRIYLTMYYLKRGWDVVEADIDYASSSTRVEISLRLGQYTDNIK